MTPRAASTTPPAAPGAAVGAPVTILGYHQPPEILPRMIATTTLPWAKG